METIWRQVVTDNNTISCIQKSSIEMIERLNYLDAEKRYYLLEEFVEWWFSEIDIEEVLFVPSWESEYEG